MTYTDEQLRRIDAMVERHIMGHDVEWRTFEYDDDSRKYKETQSWNEAHAGLRTALQMNEEGTRQPCNYDQYWKWTVVPLYTTDHNAVAEMRGGLRELGKHVAFGIAISNVVAAVFESQSGSREDEQFVFADDMCDILDSSPLQQCLAALAAVGVDVEKELAEVQHA